MGRGWELTCLCVVLVLKFANAASECSSWNTPNVVEPSKRCDDGRGGVFDRIAKLQQARIQTQPFDVLFHGDSIFATFNGTGQEGLEAALNWKCWYCDAQVPDVFRRVVGRFHRAAVFAIGGDQTMHLLWRLREGALVAPHCAAVKAVVLNIGCNDVGTLKGSTTLHADGLEIAERIKEVALELLQLYPNAKVLVVGVLPRGPRNWDTTTMAISDDGTATGTPPVFYMYPNPTFTPAIESVNGALRTIVTSLAPGRSHYIECSSPFLDPASATIRHALMPDAVHPNAAGATSLAACIANYLSRLVPPRSIVDEL